MDNTRSFYLHDGSSILSGRTTMQEYRIQYVTTYGKFTTLVRADSPNEARDRLVAQFNHENELLEITSVQRTT